MPAVLEGCDILEVACGTGYWTHVVAPAARSLVAIYQSTEMLEIAARKSFPPGRVRLVQAEAYDLRPLPGKLRLNFYRLSSDGAWLFAREALHERTRIA